MLPKPPNRPLAEKLTPISLEEAKAKFRFEGLRAKAYVDGCPLAVIRHSAPYADLVWQKVPGGDWVYITTAIEPKTT